MLETSKLVNLKNIETGERYSNAMICTLTEDTVTFTNNKSIVTKPRNIIEELVNDDKVEPVNEQSNEKFISKKSLAESLYVEMPNASRKEVIAALMEMGLAKNSASIYHNKIWVKARKDAQPELTGTESVDQTID